MSAYDERYGSLIAPTVIRYPRLQKADCRSTIRNKDGADE